MFKRSILAVLAALSGVASAQSFYIDADPPGNWRHPSNYADGYARMYLGSFGGSTSSGGVSAWVGEVSTAPLEIRWSAVNPYPDDPLRSFLWSITPGATAYAYVPAAVYGMGVLANAFIRVGGRTIIAPSFNRLAPIARNDMARQTFRGAGVGVVSTMLLAAGMNWVWDQAQQKWVRPDSSSEVSNGFEYRMEAAYGGPLPWVSSQAQSCRDYAALTVSDTRYPQTAKFVRVISPTGCVMDLFHRGQTSPFAQMSLEQLRRGSACPAGWYVTPAGCIQTPQPEPVPEVDFTQKIITLPWPDELPSKLPDGVPVERPVINPLPSPWDKPKPLFDPIGDPVKNPQFNPSLDPSVQNPPRIQPGREIQGSPTESNPWRVSVQPVDKPVVTDSDVNQPQPQPDPSQNPEDPAAPPVESPNKPSERVPLLCEVFPNISACQVLGDAPPPEQLEEDQKNIQITPDSGWGPDSGSCPSPVTIRAGLDFSYQPYCDFATGVRPLIIGFSWLAAGLMVVGVARRSP